ncbi:MAG: hypothetical protein HFE39_09075 [Clostridiales bacterium]|jgi:hypothetical protein|nr:hypothetical protein [Clostridiales bacterium]
MPTNHKTPKLQLNSWLGTDKPMRSDFVEDNTLLDALLGGHLEDSQLHLSQQDRTALSSPFVVTLLGGTGDASRNHVLPFAPRLVLVYLRNAPFSRYDADRGCTVCNAAAAGSGSKSGGIALNGTTLTLTQSQSVPEDHIFYNLNANGGQYACVAFR